MMTLCLLKSNPPNSFPSFFPPSLPPSLPLTYLREVGLDLVDGSANEERHASCLNY